LRRGIQKKEKVTGGKKKKTTLETAGPSPEKRGKVKNR